MKSVKYTTSCTQYKISELMQGKAPSFLLSLEVSLCVRVELCLCFLPFLRWMLLFLVPRCSTIYRCHRFLMSLFSIFLCGYWRDWRGFGRHKRKKKKMNLARKILTVLDGNYYVGSNTYEHQPIFSGQK